MTGAASWLRLYPPNDYLRNHRRSVRLTTEEAASVGKAEAMFVKKYKKPMTPSVIELPDLT